MRLQNIKNIKKMRFYLAPGMPGSGKIALLILFCLFIGSIYCYVVQRSLSGEQQLSLARGKIQTPGNIVQDAPSPTSNLHFHSDDYKQVQVFKDFLDSLARVPNGQVIFDSLIRVRSGLIDSIIILDNLYQYQSKYRYHEQSE